MRPVFLRSEERLRDGQLIPLVIFINSIAVSSRIGSGCCSPSHCIYTLYPSLEIRWVMGICLLGGKSSIVCSKGKVELCQKAPLLAPLYILQVLFLQPFLLLSTCLVVQTSVHACFICNHSLWVGRAYKCVQEKALLFLKILFSCYLWKAKLK